MTEISERTRAVQERMAQRSDAARRLSRFGRTGLKKPLPATRRSPMPDAGRASREAAGRPDAGDEPSRFG